jgi:DNA-directed RNA polymerase specialized sigma24 family protein
MASPILSQEIPRLSWIAAHAAVPPFMTAYIFGDEWDPTRASLRGCFINASLLAFGREYHQFLQEESPPREFLTSTGEIEQDDDNPLVRLYATAAEEDALRAQEIERILDAELSPEDKLMFIRMAQGFKQRTIAEELGISEAAVSTRMRRNRTKFTDRRHEDGERDD